MLRKYLVVLGYSGKWRCCWTTLVVFFIKMFHVRGRHQMMNSSFYVCDHANSILFSSFPHCLGWFASLTALALKRRSLEWISGLHVCSVHFEVALPFSFFCILCVCISCISISTWGSEAYFLISPLLRSHSRSPSESVMSWLKGRGVLSVTVSHLKCRRCSESFCGPWMCRGRSGRSWSGKAEAWCWGETETPHLPHLTTHNRAKKHDCARLV